MLLLCSVSDHFLVLLLVINLDLDLDLTLGTKQDAALSQGGPRNALYISKSGEYRSRGSKTEVSKSRWHRAVFDHQDNTAFELAHKITVLNLLPLIALNSQFDSHCLHTQCVDGLWATKSEGVGLIVRAISFQHFQLM